MTRKTLERGDFRLLHYAGEVTYCVVGKRNHNVRPCYSNIWTFFFFFFIFNWLTAIFGDILGFLDKNNDLLYRNIKDVSLQTNSLYYVRQGLHILFVFCSKMNYIHRCFPQHIVLLVVAETAYEWLIIATQQRRNEKCCLLCLTSQNVHFSFSPLLQGMHDMCFTHYGKLERYNLCVFPPSRRSLVSLKMP